MLLKPQPTQLQVGQFEPVPRRIAGAELTLFLINEQPYIAIGDAANVMGVHERTLRAHLDNIYLEYPSVARGGG